jgi:hypothetical protein
MANGWRGRNTSAHEVYDPAANRWTALAYVPTARDHLRVNRLPAHSHPKNV